jgi:RNA polymerase sigma-70 factor (ECF subfamily)
MDPRLSVIDGSARPARVPEFRAVFVDHYGFVVRLLAHFRVPRATCEDAAQEVFAVVHRRLPDFDPRMSMRAWLWGIARRVAAGAARGELRARRRLEVVSEPSAPPAPDAELERRRDIELVERCIAELDDDQRDVFVLVEVEGLSAPEVTEALGVKLNTVYSRLRAARIKFERTLARARAKERRDDDGRR